MRLLLCFSFLFMHCARARGLSASVVMRSESIMQSYVDSSWHHHQGSKVSDLQNSESAIEPTYPPSQPHSSPLPSKPAFSKSTHPRSKPTFSDVPPPKKPADSDGFEDDDVIEHDEHQPSDPEIFPYPANKHGDVIEVVTATDPGFVDILPTMLTSLHRHHKVGEVRVSILTVGLSGEAQGTLKKDIANCCSNLKIQMMVPETLGFTTFFGARHVSAATMLRLQIPTLLPDASRAIWLDGDLVVRSSLHRLWDGSACHGNWNTTDSSGICARTTNSGEGIFWHWNTKYKEAREQTKIVKSFNAGVLLMDLDVLRRNGYPGKIRGMLKVCNLEDQQALNFYAHGMYAELDPEWNSFVTDKHFDSIADPRVVHFNGNDKAWCCNTRNKALHYWREYTNSTHCRTCFKYAHDQPKPPLPPAAAGAPRNGGLRWVWNAKPPREDGILIVWSSVRDVPEAFIEHAYRLVQLHGNRKIYGLCAAPQCIRRLSKIGVHTEKIRLSTLVLDVHLKQWFANHALYKVLSGPGFEDHFHRAVVIAALYQYGGLYIDLKATPQNPFPTAAFQRQWAVAPSDGGMWLMGRFESQSPEIYNVSKEFSSLYADAIERQERIDDKFYHTIQKHLHHVPGWSSSWGIFSDFVTTSTKHGQARVEDYSKDFGTLSMDLRTKYLEKINDHAVNLGDEMQAFPGIQFLPRIDYFVERDDLGSFGNFTGAKHSKRQTLVFLNGWYGTPTMSWPPSANVDPILNAVHIEKDAEKVMLAHTGLDYVRKNGGAGARDEETLQLYEKHGTSTELTGCMTLLMQALPWEKRFHDTSRPINGSYRIYIVDTPDDVLQSSGIPKNFLQNAERISHHYAEEDRFDKYVRYSKAGKMLELLRGARLVITSRLHAALPSVSMGIPTIFVKHDKLPGGYDKQHDRIDASLMELFHVVDLTGHKHGSHLEGFDYYHPPRNPGSDKLHWFRQRLFRRICSKPYLKDYFKMFADQHTIRLMSEVQGCQ